MSSFRVLVSFFLIIVLARVLSVSERSVLHLETGNNFFIENAVFDNPTFHNDSCYRIEFSNNTIENTIVQSIFLKNPEKNLSVVKVLTNIFSPLRKSTRSLNIIFRVLRI